MELDIGHAKLPLVEGDTVVECPCGCSTWELHHHTTFDPATSRTRIDMHYKLIRPEQIKPEFSFRLTCSDPATV